MMRKRESVTKNERRKDRKKSKGSGEMCILDCKLKNKTGN